MASNQMQDTTAAPAASPNSSPSSASASSSGSYQLTPLYGCESSTGGALCSLLRLDECTILLDLGWDERYSEDMFDALKGVISEVDAVLISYPDLAHLGALPYAIGKLGLSCPIYCTLPVWRMGQMFMYDAYQALADYTTPPFSLDDVDKAFDQMRQLKYSETVRLSGDSDEGIEITPSCAGHMLGGAFWHIQSKRTESIIYAVDFNHAAERHLNGALLNAPQLHRPSALITDASNALVTSVKRSVQDTNLATTITDRLRMGGNVLLPVDAAGRVLELLLVIHGMWASQQLFNSYTLAFLSPQSHNTVDFARSQLEWMTDRCRKMFDTNKVNPFAFQYLKFVTSKKELDALPKPYCCLASNANLETSLAQDVFVDLCNDSKNLVLFTSRAAEWSVGGKFFDSALPNAIKSVLPQTITFDRRRKVELTGLELEQYEAEQKMSRQQNALEHEKGAVDDMEDEEDEDEAMIDLAAKGAQTGLALGQTAQAARIKAQQQKYPLFPFAEPKRTFDLWGEILTADEVAIITGASAQPRLSAANARSYSSGHDGGRYASQNMRNRNGGGGGGFHNNMKSDVQDNHHMMQDVPRDGDDAEADADEITPTKCVKESITIPLLCAVQYLDFEGRSDGRSMKTVIKDVLPRKLIILSGAANAKESLKQHCLTQDICKDVVVPKSNQTVSVTSESNLYRITLKDALFAQLNFVQVSDEIEVAYVEGSVKLNQTQATLPVLQSTTSTTGHAAVFLGQVRPSELQQLLQNEGIEADLVGGVVVCMNGMVNVHKVNDFQISIKGALCDEYYRIRDILYGQYLIV